MRRVNLVERFFSESFFLEVFLRVTDTATERLEP